MRRTIWELALISGSLTAAGAGECVARVEGRAKDAQRLQEAGELERAAAGLRKVLTGLETAPCAGVRLDGVMTRMGHILQQQGKPLEAERFYRQALGIRTKEYGAKSADAASTLSDIATALIAQGRMSEAEDLLRQAVALMDQGLGPEHSDTLIVRNNLGVLLLMTGQHARAEPVLRSVTNGFERLNPPPTKLLLTSYQNLAAVHFGQREFAEAERYTRMHLKLAETIGAAGQIAAALSNLISIHIEQKRIDEADLLFPRAMELTRPGAARDLDYAVLLTSRAAIRKAQKRYREAASDLREAIGLLEKAEAFRAPPLADALLALASVLKEQKLKGEAKAVDQRVKMLFAEHEGAAWTGRGERGRGFLIAPSGQPTERPER